MKLKQISHHVLTTIEAIGLLIITVCTLIAIGFELEKMFAQQIVTLADLLLLFIYLEVLAMIAIYLESGKLPVRMPLYIAMVALSRYMILDMKNLDTWRIVGIAGAIFLIAITVLVLRYGNNHYPYEKKNQDDTVG